MQLEDDESEALIETWLELQSHYKPVAVSPKTMAWYHFGVTFFAVYAKKIRDIRARKKAAKAAEPPRPAPTGPRVVNLREAGLARTASPQPASAASVEPMARPEQPHHAPPPGVDIKALTPSQLTNESGALDDGAA